MHMQAGLRDKPEKSFMPEIKTKARGFRLGPFI